MCIMVDRMLGKQDWGLQTLHILCSIVVGTLYARAVLFISLILTFLTVHFSLQ